MTKRLLIFLLIAELGVGVGLPATGYSANIFKKFSRMFRLRSPRDCNLSQNLEVLSPLQTQAVTQVIQHFQELPAGPLSSESCKAHPYTTYNIIEILKGWEKSGNGHHAWIAQLLRIQLTREDWDAPLSPEFFLICNSLGKVYAVGNLIESEANFLYLNFLVSAPDPQQRGAGKAALEYVMALALLRNKEGVLVESIPSAEGFYSRMGMTRLPDDEGPSSGLRKFVVRRNTILKLLPSGP